MPQRCRHSLILGASLSLVAAVWGSPVAAEPPVMVVNAAGDAAARARARARVADLRARLVAKGLARDPAAELRGVLEGELRSAAAPHAFDPAAAKEAYKAFEYDRAAGILDAELNKALASAPMDQLADAVEEILYWRGKATVFGATPRDAARWFRAVLNLDPTRSYDVVQDPPPVQKAFRKARAVHKKKTPGSVRLEVEAAGAVVAIDGGSFTRVPAKPVPISAGLHLVVVDAPDHRHAARLVDVAARRETVVRISLETEARDVQVERRLAAALAVPSGSERLALLGQVSSRVEAPGLLVVDRDGGRLQVRLYQPDEGRVSDPIALGDSGLPIAVERLLSPPPVTTGQAIGRPTPRTRLFEHDTPTVSRRRSSTAWYRRWWVWTAAAGVVGATSLIYVTRDRSPEFVCCSTP